MKDKVYIVVCKGTIINVFDSKEKAFRSLKKEDKYTKYTQTIRTHDGEEEIIPTEDAFYMDSPIYVHIDGHAEDIMGIITIIPEEDICYEIKEFKIK